MLSPIDELLAFDLALKSLAQQREEAAQVDDLVRAEFIESQHRELDWKRQAFRAKMSEADEIAYEIARG